MHKHLKKQFNRHDWDEALYLKKKKKKALKNITDVENTRILNSALQPNSNVINELLWTDIFIDADGLACSGDLISVHYSDFIISFFHI